MIKFRCDTAWAVKTTFPSKKRGNDVTHYSHTNNSLLVVRKKRKSNQGLVSLAGYLAIGR